MKMNIRTQMALFDRKNPIIIKRKFDNDDPHHRPAALDKKCKNNVQINFHNISSKALDIPDIFSHSLEKHKYNNISSYSKISKIKQNKSQKKI